MPKVSVIVPVYNVEKFIARCARSLLGQTLDDIELLFVDDCSPDDSIAILKREIEKFDNKKIIIRILRMPANSGLAAVRRHGINAASGEYVIHCDSDDWVDVDMYRRLYEKAKSENLDIVWCDYYRSDGVEHKHVQVQHDQHTLMQGPVWNKLVRRSLYVDNDIDFPVGNKAEDGALMTQLSYYAKTRGYVAAPLYYYYNNPNSICGNVSVDACLSKLKQEMDNTALRIRFLRKKGLEDKYKHDVIIWKYECRKNILPIIKKSNYKKMWRNIYPEINKEILVSNKFSLRFKLRFILYLLNSHF